MQFLVTWIINQQSTLPGMEAGSSIIVVAKTMDEAIAKAIEHIENVQNVVVISVQPMSSIKVINDDGNCKKTEDII